MTDAPIAGWYPDPRDAAVQWRWWNGRDWTHETAVRNGEPGDVVVPVRRAQDWGWSSAAPARTPLSASSSSPNTVWIWILAFFSPLYGMVGGVLQSIALLAFGRDITSAQLVGAVALGAALVPFWVFAELDGRALRSRGLEAPSVLWMILLPPLVYFVVRGRKLRRAGARSVGPERALLIVVAVQIVGAAIAVWLAFTVLSFYPGGPPLL